jgi:hypothetical protein
MINVNVFGSPQDPSRNGGYCFAQVFIENYLAIFNEYVNNGVLSKDIYNFEKRIAFKNVIPPVVKYVVLNTPSNYKNGNTWTILFKHYGVVKTVLAVIVGLIKYFGKKIFS